jgi:type IV secretion system protein TrbL
MSDRSFNASSGGSESDDRMPGWARAMKAQQSTRHHGQAAMRAVEQGDRGGHGANPDIKERED